jgi:hypothetical protein
MLRQAPSRKSMGVEGIRQRLNRYATGLRTSIRIKIRPSLLYGFHYFAGRVSIVVEVTIPRQASMASSSSALCGGKTQLLEQLTSQIRVDARLPCFWRYCAYMIPRKFETRAGFA